jgi:hypothetical protein
LFVFLRHFLGIFICQKFFVSHFNWLKIDEWSTTFNISDGSIYAIYVNVRAKIYTWARWCNRTYEDNVHSILILGLRFYFFWNKWSLFQLQNKQHLEPRAQGFSEKIKKILNLRFYTNQTLVFTSLFPKGNNGHLVSSIKLLLFISELIWLIFFSYHVAQVTIIIMEF